ncbi:MAG: hypothetical protein Q8K45_20735 [Rubrivivax sp.]|nr:hypothetical protein [Rubrivivax sp.]
MDIPLPATEVAAQAHRPRRLNAAPAVAALALLLCAATATAQVPAPPATSASMRPLDLSLRSAASAPPGPRSAELTTPRPYGSGYESRRLTAPNGDNTSATGGGRAGEQPPARATPAPGARRAAAGRDGGGRGHR